MSAADQIHRLYAAVNTQDLATLEAFGCENSEWLDVPFEYLARGPRAIVDPWAAWLSYFPDTDCQPYSVVEMGDTVVAQGVTTATHRGAFDSPAGRLEPTGRRIKTRFCDVFRFKGDKIIRADSYFDFYGLLGQLAPELLPKMEEPA